MSSDASSCSSAGSRSAWLNLAYPRRTNSSRLSCGIGREVARGRVLGTAVLAGGAAPEAQAFEGEEQALICRLGVEYDDVAGRTLDGHVMELVVRAHRDQQIHRGPVAGGQGHHGRVTGRAEARALCFHHALEVDNTESIAEVGTSLVPVSVVDPVTV